MGLVLGKAKRPQNQKRPSASSIDYCSTSNAILVRVMTRSPLERASTARLLLLSPVWRAWSLHLCQNSKIYRPAHSPTRSASSIASSIPSSAKKDTKETQNPPVAQPTQPPYPSLNQQDTSAYQHLSPSIGNLGQAVPINEEELSKPNPFSPNGDIASATNELPPAQVRFFCHCFALIPIQLVLANSGFASVKSADFSFGALAAIWQ